MEAQDLMDHVNIKDNIHCNIQGITYFLICVIVYYFYVLVMSTFAFIYMDRHSINMPNTKVKLVCQDFSKMTKPLKHGLFRVKSGFDPKGLKRFGLLGMTPKIERCRLTKNWCECWVFFCSLCILSFLYLNIKTCSDESTQRVKHHPSKGQRYSIGRFGAL